MGRRKGIALAIENVVATTIALLRDEGESALGVNRVARALDVTPPSLYNHVDGNDGLRAAVALEGLRRFVDALEKAAEGKSGRPALEKMAHAFRAFVHENPALYRVVSSTPLPPRGEAVRVNTRLIELLASHLGVMGVAAADVTHAIRSLRSGLHGFVLLEHTRGQFAPEPSPDRTFRFLVKLVLDGLEKER